MISSERVRNGWYAIKVRIWRHYNIRTTRDNISQNGIYKDVHIHICPPSAARTRRSTDAGLMLAQRRRRWANVKPASFNTSCLLGQPLTAECPRGQLPPFLILTNDWLAFMTFSGQQLPCAWMKSTAALSWDWFMYIFIYLAWCIEIQYSIYYMSSKEKYIVKVY